MFTGLVQDLGKLVRNERSERGARLAIETPLAGELSEGQSVAVNGVCLTAIGTAAGSFAVEAMNETLARSSLGELEAGSAVNVELPLRAGDRLGGHVVQGHVDGLGRVLEVREDGIARRLRIEVPRELMRYLVEKGAIAIDGVSLTVGELDRQSVTVSLIPETLERTNLGGAQPGMKVNLEVDVLAKYVESAVRSGGATA